MNPQDPHGGTTRRVGPYRLEELLGTGGMGRVWRAWDERLKRTVAIKHILADALENPKIRERFRQEATAGARLNHPAIVHIYDLVENEEGDWIVMELVRGRTLRSLLDEAPLDLSTTLRLGREIAEGLAQAHAHGIIHRDLKTGNIMVNELGGAKILDFGLAKLLYADEQDQTLSRPGMLLGTPYAMSPEQVLGQPVDHRSDLFSFGTLLYEMVTGLAPFRGETIPMTLGRICSLRQPPVRELLPSTPPELSQLIDHLLQKEPQHRPAGTAEVATVLGELAARFGREAEGTGVRSSVLPGPLEDELGVTVSEAPPASRRSWSEPTALPLDFPLGTSERRQVSVICCGLGEVLDHSGEWISPGLEILSEAMPALRSLAQEVAARFEAHLGTTLGHLLWLYFGYPTAHGDDAQRAVRAARELVARVGDAAWARGVSSRLALRVGVHSGPAIVSKDPRQSEHLALGPTLDLATGLQSLAPAHGVLVSEPTQRMIAASFALEPQTPARLQGFAEPVSAWQVTAPLEALEKTPAALTPLVGRERELDLIHQRWQLAEAGEGQAILVGGEAGVGKSRLLRAFRERLSGREPWWHSCYGSAYTRSSPFYPVIELLRRQWLQPAASPAEELALLEGILRQNDLPVDETLPLFAALLSLPAPAGLPPLALSPEAQRKKTLEALVQLFLQAADRQPGILVVEDLHWLDPSTLAWIGALLDALGAAPLLLVLTYRLEFQFPWPWRSQWTQLSLSRLTDAEADDLIDRIAGRGRLAQRSPLSSDVRRQIIAKSDGIPLFIEELTKTAVESAEHSGVIGIPSLLRDSLTARLDRMGMAKEVAQLAAVIGRAFSFELISAVSPFDPETLQRELDRLVKAELVYRKGVGVRGQYLFKHALLQDAACELLLARDLQRIHQRVAEVLESRFPEIVDAQPELVAHHLTQAQQLDQASAYWLRAGQSALRRFANIEGIKHLQEGLACLRALPPSAERDRRELEIQVALGPALVMERGHSEGEVKASFDRVLELSRHAGEVPKEIQLLLWGFYNTRGEIRTSRSLALQMAQAAETQGDVGFLVYAVQAVASSHFYAGDMETALAAHHRVLELYPADLEHPLLGWMGWDPRILALCELGQNLWFHGRPDEGLARGNEALAFVRKLGHPPSLAIAYLLLAFIHHFRREDAEARRYAQSLYDHCREQGFHFFQAHSSFFLGLTGAIVASRGSEVETGLQQALEGLAAIRTVHQQELHAPLFLSWIAEVLIAHGRRTEAADLLAEALESVERREERFWEPEVHRLQGVIERSEEKLQKALAAARRSGSVALELRAAIDLAGLWQQDGRSEEAERLLAGVYETFTEGLDTPDLQAACTLLASIRSVSTAD